LIHFCFKLIITVNTIHIYIQIIYRKQYIVTIQTEFKMRIIWKDKISTINLHDKTDCYAYGLKSVKPSYKSSNQWSCTRWHYGAFTMLKKQWEITESIMKEKWIVSYEDDWDSATISDRSFLFCCIALSTIPTFYIIYIIGNDVKDLTICSYFVRHPTKKIIYKVQNKIKRHILWSDLYILKTPKL